MSFESLEAIWWESLTGPAGFIHSVTDLLKEKKTVLLRLVTDVPWPEQMRSAIERQMREFEPNLSFEQIRFLSSDLPVGDVPGFLMRRFAVKEIRDAYRSASGVSVQRYMQEHSVLKNRVIWVIGACQQEVDVWLSFCRKFVSDSVSGGLFVVETRGNNSIRALPAHIRSLDYLDFVRPYDIQLFCNLATAKITQESDDWKRYFAAVAAHLCGVDGELAVKLIRSGALARQEPLDALTKFAEEDTCSARRSLDSLSSEHPFSMLARGDNLALRHRVWKAQLGDLFSIIERERIALIDRHIVQIKLALSTPYLDSRTGTPRTIMQFGEVVTDAYDVEIGTLFFMMNVRKANGVAEPLLFLPRVADRERVALLREVRNYLAHTKPCPIDKVQLLLSCHPFEW